MRYQLAQPFAFDPRLAPIEAGTIVDTSLAEFAYLADVVPPLAAAALDQPTFDRMCEVYPPYKVLTAGYSPINRTPEETEMQLRSDISQLRGERDKLQQEVVVLRDRVERGRNNLTRVEEEYKSAIDRIRATLT